MNIAAMESVILDVAEGATLRAACRKHELNHSTFLRWLGDQPELAAKYAKAQDTKADADFEALDDLQSEKPPKDSMGKIDNAWVAFRRLQIDTMKWALAKRRPKKYSERVIQAGDPEMPVQHALTMTDAELAAIASRGPKT